VTAAAAGRADEATQGADAIAHAAVDVGTRALRDLAPGADTAAVRAAVYERVEALRSLLFGVSLVREMTPQTIDSVVSFGERIASAVVAAVLTASGRPAMAVDARTWTVTDDTFGAALVDWEATQGRVDALAPSWEGRVSVHTGFIGATTDGRTTTLGRNGSDYTATLLARGLGAREVVRWTDVSGVMTADPELVDDAYPIALLTYAEALELANFGAKVFHQRTMIPLMESGIPMRIRDTMSPDAPGTLIDAVGAADAEHATSVTSLEHLALIGVQWRRLPEQARMGERVLRALDEADVTVWMANQSAHGQSVAVVVPQALVDRACDAIRRALRDEIARGDLDDLSIRSPVTLLSLVAEAMGRTPNVAGRYFGALGAMGVNVLAIAQGASSRSVSAVIAADDTAVAVRTVHSAFNFSHQEVNLLLVGCGTVGSALLEQINSQREALLARQNVLLRVVGIANSTRVAFDAAGIDLGAWRARLAGAEGGDLDAAVAALGRLPAPILVDCTASDDLIGVIARGFAHGVHAAAANKKPFAADRAAYAALFAAARAHHRDLRYETTVGASLPVIETLKDLVRTGDVVRRIEGSFSGTLGYVCNELSAGVPIHEAVAAARRLGYTEPNPAEDLNGQDVARKALILARELGLDADLADVVVEPLVPAALLQSRTADELLARLAEAAPAIAARVESLAAEGKQLRYLARIVLDDGTPRIAVGPVGVDARHPAARLVGTEAFVAFTTERHATYPLLVQGAGAGAQVTASGVLADVLGIARSARGR
jgi:aspartokinase/homoserine dehydrogenase 1